MVQGSMFFKTTKTLNFHKDLSKQFLLVVLLVILPLHVAYAVAIDVTMMLNAIKSNIGPVIKLVTAVAYVIGVWFIYSAIQSLKRAGQSQMMMQQQNAIGGPLVKLIIGILLIYLPNTIDITVWTLWGHTAFGSEAESVMTYTPSGGDPFGAMKEGAIALVRLIGYIAFVRGLVALSHSTDQGGGQQGGFAKGILYLIGGILAINIVETVRVIGNTLGFTTI